MEKLFSEANAGVVVACDVATEKELYELVDKTKDVEGIVGYKLGFTLGTGYGLRNVVPNVRELTDKTIIYDHQKAGTDIPGMGSKFGNLMGDVGVDAAIIFPQAGPRTQEAFIQGLVDNGVIPIGGGEMTHPEYLSEEGGYIQTDAPDKMYNLFLENKVREFVVPGNKPDAIKRYVNGPFKNFVSEIGLHSPGHGKQGGVLSAAVKAAFPARYFGIIGSGIYAQEDIKKAAERWATEATETRKDLEERASGKMSE